MAFRIAVLYLLTTLALLVALGAGVYYSTEQGLLDARRRDLQAAADSTAGLVSVAVNTQEALIALAPTLAQSIAAPQGGSRTLRIFTANGALVVAMPPPADERAARRPSTATANLLPPSLLSLAILPVDDPNAIYAAQAIPGRNSTTGVAQTIGVVEVAQPRDQVDAILRPLRSAFAVAGLVAALLALLIGWLLARSVTAPVRRLQAVAASIAGGDLQRRATNLPANEIGALGHSFNVMATRLADLLGEAQGEQGRLQAILSSLADGVLACDSDGTLTLHNPAARDILGLGAAASEQAIVERLTAAGIDQIWRRAMGQTPNGQPGLIEQELQLDNRSILALASPVYSANAASLVSGCVTVLRDTTRLRELEQARSTLVRRLGHELRTPLTALVATVDNMRDTAAPEQEAALTTVESEALRLSRLVDELLAVSRGDAILPGATRPIELVSLAVAVCGLFKRRAERLEIALLAPTGGQAVVRGDPDRLRQVIVNLLDNALRYVQPGGKVTVVVQTESGEAVLTVADNGPGLDAAPATPDKTTLPAPHGSGLGLSIVRDIVAAHGGRITLNSTPNQGATITIRLPLAR